MRRSHRGWCAFGYAVSLALPGAPVALADTRQAPQPNAQQLAAFLLKHQDPDTALLTSYPASPDPALQHVAFTYDMAVAALVLSHRGHWHAAGRLLSLYRRMPIPTREQVTFMTAYQVLQARPTLEYRLHGGPLYWTAIALIRYGEATGHAPSISKGLQLLGWVRRELPHMQGGVVMGVAPPWDTLMSVENNWVYYGALRVARRAVSDERLRRALTEELRAVRRWLAVHCRDRGDGDPVKALDVYTHALLVGPDAHLEDAGLTPAELDRWARGWIDELEALFRVPGTARYDYTDAREARLLGRPRAGWLEGTEQVAVAYRTWAAFFEARGDRMLAQELRMRAALAHQEVLGFALRDGHTWAVPNTDAARPFQTFMEGWTARSRWEPAVNGTTWAYFADVGYNPFTTALPAKR